jgi:asparagine synthase (glutamine-hydrolysing)
LNASSIIGFHRLAINDLSSKGEQPFCVFTTEYKYTVIANGEIYNHEELIHQFGLEVDSRSDCAVILPLFLKLGDNFEELNNLLHGEYAIFITKEETKTGAVDYFLATDPLSVRPAFYYFT